MTANEIELLVRRSLILVLHVQIRRVGTDEDLGWLSKVYRPTENIGHIEDGFYRSYDSTNSVKAVKEDRNLRIRLQSHQVHPTVLQ